MSDTTWSHQNKEWQVTLDLARRLGWDAPQKLGNHGGLLLKCPVGDARHQMRIFSTGRGTETPAINFRKKIRNCAHRDLTEPLARIESHLTGVGRLLGAVEGRLAVAEAEEHMELLANLDLADEQLASVEKEFDSAADIATQARESLDPELAHRTPVDLADEAGTSLRGADLALRDDLPVEHEDWQTLRDRHDDLKGRLVSVRQRLSAGDR